MKNKICIVGLGYVGLPLAHAFSSKYDVIGFDILEKRINELNKGIDRTLELSADQMQECVNNGLKFTANIKEVQDCDVYIVTVPTPIDKHKRPQLDALIKASETVGTVLDKGNIVIYESTVYPGVTEEECVPVLEKNSGFKFNKGFYCGYSPERINPGDKQHTVKDIIKVTSGSTPSIAKEIDSLYKKVISAGTYPVESIKIAEAAKVIENSQRDLNIAFVNELAVMFNKLGIDTKSVLDAASTKWNFLPFKPGLVGGHCIGVDPYYLAHKAQEIGYNPEVILAGRRLNDNMGVYVANQAVKLMTKKGLRIKDSKILVLGLTFKENCPDIRNSGVINVINELMDFGVCLDVYDPLADPIDVEQHLGIKLIQSFELKFYDAVILAVAHDEFKGLDLNIGENKVLYDIKSIIDKNLVDGRL